MLSPITTLYTYFPLEFFIRMTIDVLIMAFGVFLAIRMYKKGTFDKEQCAACIILFIWSAFVLLLTVLGRRSHDDYTLNYNIELFSCYRRIFNDGDKSMLRSVIQNILMFIPIGFTLTVVFKNKHRVIFPLAVCFLLSLFIETCQLFMKSGIFEFDDLFNNTLGGLLGIIISLIISAVYKKFQEKSRKEDILATKSHR